MGLYGGAEILIKEFSSHLTAMGIKNLVVTLNLSEEVKKACAGIDIVFPKKEFPYEFRSASLKSALGIMDEINHLHGLVKKHAPDFDVINCHNFPASWVCGRLGKPVVWMCNEIPDFYNNPKPSLLVRAVRRAGIIIDRFIVNRDIDEIICADELNAGHARARYGRIPHIVPYGVDYEFFSSKGGPGEWEKLSQSFLLVQVGMLTLEKNQIKSIQAVESLKSRIPGLKLVLAGTEKGLYAGQLREYVREHGLQDRVIFAGQLSKIQVRELYRACKIALFPVKLQGGWLAPFEALSAGKPIIVSSTMGASAIIKKESLGYVEDDLVRAISDIHENPGRSQKLAETAAFWVGKNISWRVFTEKLCAIFEQAVKKTNVQQQEGFVMLPSKDGMK
jgi:glycosyltransferase involved in cell wall biosynthesis